MIALRPSRVAVLLLALSRSAAGETAHVMAVDITAEPGGTFRISATVRSQETGWEKYADRWEVLGPDGGILATRVLLHPHVDEQPFTRSLGGVRIRDGVDRVTLRAHDSVDGYGGAEMTVPVPGR